MAKISPTTIAILKKFFMTFNCIDFSETAQEFKC